MGHRKSSKKYCEIRKCGIYDNKGFTLVELLVGIAIVAIVGGLIGTFLIFSTRTYGKVTDEADLQEDAQILLSQMDNYIIDTDSALRYYADVSESGSGTEILKDSLYPGGAAGLTRKWLEIYKTTDTGYTKETVLWTKSTEKLTYKQETIDAAGTVTENIEEQELATHVTDFSIDLTKVTSLRQVTVSIALASGEKSYGADTTVYLRNQIVVNGEPYKPDAAPVISSVLSVKVLPQTVMMRPGGRKAFQAIVYGNNSPSQEVTWSLSGNTSSLTTISADGLLWISMDEKAKTLTVTATSVQDTTKSGTAEVTVVHGKKLSLGQIRKYWLQQGTGMYIYARVNGTLTGNITWTCTPIDLLTVNTVGSNTIVAGYPSLDLVNARKVVTADNTPLGEYTVKISGMVDGQQYEDTVYIEVIKSYKDSQGTGTLKFERNYGLDYWVHPGDTLNLSTITTQTIKEVNGGGVRSYEFTEGGNIGKTDYSYTTSGNLNEKLQVNIDKSAEEGEIYVTVKTGIHYTYYDTVTIHIGDAFDFPYIVETTNITSSSNDFWKRINFRGPVKIVESESDLTNLKSGLNGWIANQGTPQIVSSDPAWTDEVTVSGVTKFTESSTGTFRAGKIINLEGVIIIDRDVTFSAPCIRTTGDTVIYVEGNHSVNFQWEDACIDGLIYAPEGNVKFTVNSGYVRGVIIAREIDMQTYNMDFSFMEKSSVMDLVNTLKAN